MHDLHESQTLMYTYSGGPPQNPNLDPLLFAELPFFANWELAQMTKWGMPGVYTLAFMDGWSPGYLGSVAYNHNGMMKMYETQSGRDITPGRRALTRRRARAVDAARAAGAARPRARVAAQQRARAQPQARRPVAARRLAQAEDAVRADAVRVAVARRGGGAPPAGAATGAAQGRGAAGAGAGGGGRGGGGSNGTGRGGGQDREWYRGIQVPPGAANNFTRRDNTNYMETGVLSVAAADVDVPEPRRSRTSTRRRGTRSTHGMKQAPYGYVIPVQRDMTRPAELVRILRLQGIEVGTANAEVKIGDDVLPGRLVRHQGRPAVLAAREEPAREAGLSRSAACAPTTTAAGRWAMRSTWT